MQKAVFRAVILISLLMACRVFSAEFQTTFPLTPLQQSLLEGFVSFDAMEPQHTTMLDFQANKRTWMCHWFPMKEQRPGGDPINNLYAEGGPLQKLDRLSGKNSQQYEYAHNRKAFDAGREFLWFGHSLEAAQSACIFQEPKREVTMRALDGGKVTFTINDIQGLMVKAISSLIGKIDFKGERYRRWNEHDEISPEMFIEVMTTWAKEGLPFVLELDGESQVWEFPYDQVHISELSSAPLGFDERNLGSSAIVQYYRIDMAGTGFAEQVRNYECFVQRDASGNITKSGWINTHNYLNNPENIWRPHLRGNIYDRSTWQLEGSFSNNPEIDMQIIYDIYMQSIQ